MKKIGILFIILMTFTTACGTTENNTGEDKNTQQNAEKADYMKLISANNNLGFQMIHNLTAKEQDNVFISPTSLMIALSMLYNGADGDTKEEIANLLTEKQMQIEELNKANASLMNLLTKASEEIELNIANSIWLNKDFHFTEAFAEQIESYYQAELEEIDVLDAKTPDLINDWVANATNDKISEIIDGPLDQDTVAYLINTIYFNGAWTDSFDEALTTEHPFYGDEDQEVELPFMTMTKEFPYLENDLFQAIKIPYGDGEMNMNIFLPKEEVGLDTFSEQLTIENWETWDTEFESKEGTLFLPKFTLEYEITLNDLLQELGITTAFDPNQANFSNMVQEDKELWLSQVKQKTFIDIHEKGTEAAGATSAEIKTTSMPIDGPFYMEVNRPFYLMITDDTNAILFMGAIYQPE
ncbi:serpin family protein [Ornithinibacillus sp. 4-3]|uniref:Serpin family protein n=1 Tax=Ornithinibacillus sp. 4-3 TaxID=3231488 RepID=A0AB39HME6_9BACI